MVYVMSDLHGQSKAFFDMLERIEFTENDELYILGDIIDRGPDAFKILEYIRSHNNVHLLMGNHEKMMLDFANSNCGDIAYDKTVYYSSMIRKMYMLWMHNGGEITYEQLSNMNKDVRLDIIQYLNSLPYYKILTVNERKFILCHARPIFYDLQGVENPTIEDMLNAVVCDDEILWCRDAYPQEIPDNFTVIHGHTPVQNQFHKNKIVQYSYDKIYDIDCGCAGGVKLACLRLDDMQEFYVYCEQ